MRAAAAAAIALAACSVPDVHYRGLGGSDAGGGDATIDAVAGVCDPFAQTGCAANEKCTWIETSSTMGVLGCVPNGNIPTGGLCSYGPFGATTGYDNCTRGNVCGNATCKAICGMNDANPSCPATATCNTYQNVFAQPNQPAFGGLCDVRCDPLNDNDFLGSGNRPGSACAASAGCYGQPGANSGTATVFACYSQVNSTLFHRSPCTTANGCGTTNGSTTVGFLNGCAEGYQPLMQDATGSTQIDCIAMCSPGNTFMGNTATQFPAGKSPHACSTANARGSFNPGSGATTTTNGDHCAFSWVFEIDSMGNLIRSPTSDTLGFCVDHTKYLANPNGQNCISLNNPPGCAAWPLCASLPLMGSANQFSAGDFGCIDSHTAGFPVAPSAPLRDLRMPYAHR